MHTHKANRDVLAWDVLQEALAQQTLTQKSLLLVENYSEEIATYCQTHTHNVTHWNRRYHEIFPASTMAPEGTYDIVIIRLPKSHAFFDMILHVIAPLLAPKANVIVYGMTDEGIKGAKKKLRLVFGNSTTLLFKKRTHVLCASADEKSVPRQSLDDFATTVPLLYRHKTYMTTFYPGMFALGTLDAGTKLLLDAVLSLIHKRNHLSLLDVGCGSGIIGNVLLSYNDTLHYTGLDNDLLALTATEKNLAHYAPRVKKVFAQDLHTLVEKYDVILSNPPMHTEKEEHTNIITDLIKTAPQHLTKDGTLIIVAQSRLNLHDDFAQAFATVTILNKTPRFTIWQGQ